jgi:hypothetical protein
MLQWDWLGFRVLQAGEDATVGVVADLGAEEIALWRGSFE